MDRKPRPTLEQGAAHLTPKRVLEDYGARATEWLVLRGKIFEALGRKQDALADYEAVASHVVTSQSLHASVVDRKPVEVIPSYFDEGFLEQYDKKTRTVDYVGAKAEAAERLKALGAGP